MRKLTSSSNFRGARSRTRRIAAGVGAVALVTSWAAAPAVAQQPQCAARDAVLDRLSDSYHEEPVSLGVTATGSLLEVLASPEGSWTIIITVPGGPTCLVSSGEGWRGAPVQIAQDPRV